MAVTSYEVGAIFTIGDRASPVLLSISKQLSALQGQIDKLAISLKDFGLQHRVVWIQSSTWNLKQEGR